MVDEIRRRAHAFRSALDQLARHSYASALRHFPRGSCGDVTDLLGTYLRERNLGEFQYVLGENHRPEEAGGYHSHAWLQQDGLIIDITADQFPDVADPVIVTRDSPWHRVFQARPLRPADFRTGGSPEVGELRRIHERLARHADTQ